MSQPPPKSTEVTWEDQQLINSFGRQNFRLHELEAQIKAKQKELEDLEDASNEMMLSDDEIVRFVIGECFVHIASDVAEEKVQEAIDNCKQQIEEITGNLSSLKESMSKLKGVLYGKFGNSINLEED